MRICKLVFACVLGASLFAVAAPPARAFVPCTEAAAGIGTVAGTCLGALKVASAVCSKPPGSPLVKAAILTICLTATRTASGACRLTVPTTALGIGNCVAAGVAAGVTPWFGSPSSLVEMIRAEAQRVPQ